MKENSMVPSIVIVRHAHRDKPTPDGDNGLSEKGREQAKDLLNEYENGTLPEAQHFWSSPKRRCIETLEPLAEAEDTGIEIVDELDEQHSDETSKEFAKRVESLVEKAKALSETVYLCSHGDLIPEAVEILTGKAVDAAKGQAIIIANKKERWILL